MKKVLLFLMILAYTLSMNACVELSDSETVGVLDTGASESIVATEAHVDTPSLEVKASVSASTEHTATATTPEQPMQPVDVKKIQVPCGSWECISGLHYTEVNERFVGAGFANLTYEKSDKVFDPAKYIDGQVVDISINGSNLFGELAVFEPDAKIVVTYIENGSGGRTYKDGFAVVTINDCVWMKEETEFVDVYIIGTIVSISNTNDILIEDSVGGKWTVGAGSDRNFAGYVGEKCEVYGFSSGAISSRYDTPYINMDHHNNKIVFAGGKEFCPESFESWQQFESKNSGNGTTGDGGLVWIPTEGGTKFHSKSTCSGMKNPEQVSKDTALNRGFSKCGKCW